MVNFIQDNSNIIFKPNKDLSDWIDLANSCGEESSVNNIRNIAKIYSTYNFSSEQNNREELVSKLNLKIGESLTEFCLKNSSVPIGECLKEILEVRDILNFCASWNKSIGDLPPKVMNINDLVDNIETFPPERISVEGIQNTDIQNLFEYDTKLNVKIQLEENTFYLKPVFSNFIVLLTKKKIDVRLIRFCQKCNKIFWIKRGTQIACSKKCINAINSANWRRENAK